MSARRTPAKERPLWKTLALWMLPTLLFLMTASLLLTVQSLRDVADSAYDRSLRGAIRAIDLRISTESGGLGVELPYPLFESSVFLPCPASRVCCRSSRQASG